MNGPPGTKGKCGGLSTPHSLRSGSVEMTLSNGAYQVLSSEDFQTLSNGAYQVLSSEGFQTLSNGAYQVM